MALGIPRDAESWPNSQGFPAFLQAQHSLPLYNEAATRSYSIPRSRTPDTRMDFNSNFRSASTQAIPCALTFFRYYDEIICIHTSTKMITTCHYVPKTSTKTHTWPLHYALYRVIRNDCRGFNNLSYTIHLREQYMYFFLFNRTTLQVFVTYLIGALYVHPLWFYRVIRNDCRGFNSLSYTTHLR